MKQPVKLKAYINKARSPDFSQRPYAKALILRGCQHLEAFDDPGFSPRPINMDRTFDEFAASGAKSVAYQITVEAAERVGCSVVFLPKPSDTLPKHAWAAVPFSLLIVTNIILGLRAEKIELDYKDLVGATALLFFMLHPKEESAKLAMKGIETYRALATSEQDDVKEWRGMVADTVALYVLQWESEDEEFWNNDFVYLLGQLFSMLMKLEVLDGKLVEL